MYAATYADATRVVKRHDIDMVEYHERLLFTLMMLLLPLRCYATRCRHFRQRLLLSLIFAAIISSSSFMLPLLQSFFALFR